MFCSAKLLFKLKYGSVRGSRLAVLNAVPAKPMTKLLSAFHKGITTVYDATNPLLASGS
jgi:hypothetical protein